MLVGCMTQMQNLSTSAEKFDMGRAGIIEIIIKMIKISILIHVILKS